MTQVAPARPSERPSDRVSGQPRDPGAPLPSHNRINQLVVRARMITRRSEPRVKLN